MTKETTQPVLPASLKRNQKSTSENFASELQSFFALCLMNLVFGALAMAFGMQFIVTAALAMAAAGTFQWFPAFQVLLGWAAAVVGFRWIFSSIKILKGVTKIRREYRAMEEPVPGETLTGLIVRMMAHYRENWKAIWRMNLISILGGCIYLALGVLNLYEGISALLAGSGPAYVFIIQEGLASGVGRTLLISFFSAAINLTIGVVCLRFSSWFRRYARAWDRRLVEASQKEEALKNVMERE